MNTIGKHTLAYLTPGLAEMISVTANEAGNLAWHGLIKPVKFFRNCVYISAPAAVISAQNKDLDRTSEVRMLVTGLFLVVSAAGYSRNAYQCARSYHGFAQQYIRKDLPQHYYNKRFIYTRAACNTAGVFAGIYLMERGVEACIRYAGSFKKS